MQQLYKRTLQLLAMMTDEEVSLGICSTILMWWFVDGEPIAGRPVSDALSVDE